MNGASQCPLSEGTGRPEAAATWQVRIKVTSRNLGNVVTLGSAILGVLALTLGLNRGRFGTEAPAHTYTYSMCVHAQIRKITEAVL